MDLFKTWLVETSIAHRGLHNDLLPENSIGAFENAIKNGYPIELDVHIISDGTIIVFHDDTLSRVTSKDGYVMNLTKDSLCEYKLLNTKYTIPTLDEVLAIVNGQVPLLIEIKNTGKVGELESKLLKTLKEYTGEYAIQSFNPLVLEWFKVNAPEIPRGQLASYFKDEKISFFKKFALKRMIFNKKLSCPHFISYDARNLPNRHVRKYKKLPLLAWTVRNQEQYLKVVKYCDNVIFENFEPKI